MKITLDFENNLILGAYDENGVPLTSNVFCHVLGAVKKYNRVLLLQKAEEDIERILAGAEWAFPTSVNGHIPRGACVYFGDLPQYPNLIKIGGTINLSNRRKSYKASQGHKLQVLAVVITEEYKVLERALHAKFEAYQEKAVSKQGDWIQRAPVIEFLSEMQRCVNG